jgi:2-polyprenyl-3-methyl-5-hydroxy-6-metoxy-1,4-benzoquinol methylase
MNGSGLSCRVCGSDQVSSWRERTLHRRLVPDDLRITDARYGMTLSLGKCRSCNFVQADGDEMAELFALYSQLDDPDYEAGRETRQLQMRWLLEQALSAHPSATSLLDVGAGTGLMVIEAKKRELAAVGVEPSHSLVASGRRINHLSDRELLQGTIPHASLSSDRFDMVCLIDVIEHVADPVCFLRDAADRLSPGGLCVIVTPDVSSAAAKTLGKRWWHFRLAHVGYFDAHSMTLAAKSARLYVTKKFRAKWFFPVKYLAERVAVYLPLVNRINRIAEQRPVLHRIYQRTIPLNLHDSLVFFLRKSENS